jgi:hypothetical protein
MAQRLTGPSGGEPAMHKEHVIRETFAAASSGKSRYIGMGEDPYETATMKCDVIAFEQP